MSQENNIELKWLFQVLRRRLALVLTGALLVGAGVFLIFSILPPSHKATTTLLVGQSELSGRTQYNDILASERMAGTYSEMLTGRAVLEEVAAQLGSGGTPAKLPQKIEARPVANTQLIQLTVTGADPAETVLVANTIANVFVVKMQRLESDRSADSLALLQARARQLLALAGAAEARLEALRETNREADPEYARREIMLEEYRSAYDVVQQNYKELQLNTTLATNDIQVVERASLVGDSVPPRALYTVVGALLGMAAAFAVAILIEHLDDTIKTPEDVEQALGLNVIGAVPPVRGGEALPSLNAPRSAGAEALRVLSANVRFSGAGGLRTILITSPGAQEGKSTLAANLAVTMAQAGLEVVLVDADLHFSRLHRLFQLAAEEDGLSGALLRTDDHLGLCPAPVKGLAVLPGGVAPYSPIQLLDSQRMKDLLVRLSGQANVVVIDSPPVLPLVDAYVLSRLVDGVLLVVRSGRTRRKEAQSAVERLQQGGARLVGIVLTAAPTTHRSHRRYYQEPNHLAGRWPLRLLEQWRERLFVASATSGKKQE